MTIEDTSALPGRLSFGTTFGAGFSIVFGRLWKFIKAAVLPLVLGLLLGGLALATVTAAPLLTIPLQILSLVPFAILGIACCRIALLGQRTSAIPRPLFGRRTWVYVGYALLFMLLLWVPFLVVGFAFLGTATASLMTDPAVADYDRLADLGLAVLTLIPFYFVYLYFILRLSLIFPAVAVDQKLGLGGSWRLTRGGTGFKLYGVFAVLAIVILIAMIVILALVNGLSGLFWLTPGALPADPADMNVMAMVATAAPAVIVTLLLEYLAFAMMIVALASAYAQLSGWGAPREEILERFE